MIQTLPLSSAARAPRYMIVTECAKTGQPLIWNRNPSVRDWRYLSVSKLPPPYHGSMWVSQVARSQEDKVPNPVVIVEYDLWDTATLMLRVKQHFKDNRKAMS